MEQEKGKENTDPIVQWQGLDEPKNISTDSLELTQVTDTNSETTSASLLLDHSIGPALIGTTSSIDSPAISSGPLREDGDARGSITPTGHSDQQGLINPREAEEYADGLARELLNSTHDMEEILSNQSAATTTTTTAAAAVAPIEATEETQRDEEIVALGEKETKVEEEAYHDKLLEQLIETEKVTSHLEEISRGQEREVDKEVLEPPKEEEIVEEKEVKEVENIVDQQEVEEEVQEIDNKPEVEEVKETVDQQEVKEVQEVLDQPNSEDLTGIGQLIEVEEVNDIIDKPEIEEVKEDTILPEVEEGKGVIDQFPIEELIEHTVDQPEFEVVKEIIEQPEIEEVNEVTDGPELEEEKQAIDQSIVEEPEEVLHQIKAEEVEETIDKSELKEVEESSDHPEVEVLQEVIEQPVEEEELVQHRPEFEEVKEIADHSKEEEAKEVKEAVDQPEVDELKEDILQLDEESVEEDRPQSESEEVQEVIEEVKFDERQLTFHTVAAANSLIDCDKLEDEMEFTKNYSDDLLMGQSDTGNQQGETMPSADLADFELPPYSGSSSGSEPPRQPSPVKGPSSSSSSAAQPSSSHNFNAESTSPNLSAVKDLLMSSYSRVSHILHWKRPIETGIIFGIGVTLIITLTFFSIISVFAYSALGVILASALIRFYKSITKALNRPSDLPFDHLWNKIQGINVSLSPEKTHELVDTSLNNLNASLLYFKQVLLFEDKIATVKFGVFLYVLTYIGAWFNGMTLITISYLALFSVPIFYQKNKTKIDEYMNLATGQLSSTLSLITNKATSIIPTGPTNRGTSSKKQN